MAITQDKRESNVWKKFEASLRPEDGWEFFGYTPAKPLIKEGRPVSGGIATLYRSDDGNYAVRVFRNSKDKDDEWRIRRIFSQGSESIVSHTPKLINEGITEDGRPFIVVEFVEGSSLSKLIDEKKLGAIDFQHRKKLAESLLDYVAQCHMYSISLNDLGDELASSHQADTTAKWDRFILQDAAKCQWYDLDANAVVDTGRMVDADFDISTYQERLARLQEFAQLLYTFQTMIPNVLLELQSLNSSQPTSNEMRTSVTTFARNNSVGARAFFLKSKFASPNELELAQAQTDYENSPEYITQQKNLKFKKNFLENLKRNKEKILKLKEELELLDKKVQSPKVACEKIMVNINEALRFIDHAYEDSSDDSIAVFKPNFILQTRQEFVGYFFGEVNAIVVALSSKYGLRLDVSGISNVDSSLEMLEVVQSRLAVLKDFLIRISIDNQSPFIESIKYDFIQLSAIIAHLLSPENVMPTYRTLKRVVEAVRVDSSFEKNVVRALNDEIDRMKDRSH